MLQQQQGQQQQLQMRNNGKIEKKIKKSTLRKKGIELMIM